MNALYGLGADRAKKEELGTAIMRGLKKLTTQEAVERLRERDICVAPVLGREEVLTHEQIVHNETVVEDEHPVFGRYRYVRPPARFSATPQEAGDAPPLLGEHVDDLLSELGYDAEAIGRLRDRGTVG